MNLNKHNKLEEMNKTVYLPLDLQLFAEGGEGAGEGNGEGSGEGGKEPKRLELTEEELQSKIDSETDKRIQKALQTAKTKWEKEFSEKLEEEKREAERLAKLSEKERRDEELKKREQDIAERLKNLERKELRADAVSVLTEKELPSSFVDFLLAENAEKTLENINDFKQAFDDAVNARVNEVIKQDVPGSGSGTGKPKNPFSEKHWNLTEQGRLFNENPDLYKKLKAEAGK